MDDESYEQYKQHIRNIFGLEKIPLQGNPQIVAEATEYRNEVLDKLAEGLAKYGDAGQLWLNDLFVSFMIHTNAQWWLQKRPQFDSLESSQLVQIIVFCDYAEEFKAMKLDTQVIVMEEDGRITRILP